MDVQGKNKKWNEMRDSIDNVYSSGKAMKRIQSLFDEETFVEVGAFVKQRPTEFGATSENEGVITGYGSVNGQLVFAFAQEPEILKGSVSEMHARKICNIMDMALKADAPLVSMIDCSGIRVNEGIDALCGYGKILSKCNELLGNILHVCVVCGTCAGALSFIPALADYTAVTEKSELFLSAPAVVEARYGKKDAGTAAVAYKNGIASVIAKDDAEAIEKAVNFIGFISEPDEAEDNYNRLVPEIETVISEDGYDAKKLIETVADNGKALYMYDGNAENIVTALVNLGDELVGVIANNPAVANGALDSAAAKKAARLVGFCNDFDIPLLTLVDTEGFEADKDENIEDAALLINAFSNAEVPKVSLVIGRAYGAGYLSMCSKATGADIALALTTAEISALSPTVGGIFFGDEIAKTEGREAAIADYKEKTASPYEAAKRGYIDDVIEPLTARQLLISSFEMLEMK